MTRSSPADRTRIVTARLAISSADRGDSEEIYALLTHPDMEHVHCPPPSAEAMAESVERTAKIPEAGDVRSNWWVARRRDDSRFVAVVRTDLESYDELAAGGPPTRQIAAEFTMYVHPALQGQQYGREVYEGLLENLQEEVGIHRIEFRIHHTNARGQSVAESLGAINTGISSPEGYEVWRLELES